MNSETRIYVIFRKRFGNNKDPIYAWTKKKDMLKCFFQERSRKKYRVIKARYIELERKFSDNPTRIDMYTLDFMKFPSHKDGLIYYILTTLEELRQYEYQCQDIFKYFSSIEKIDQNRIEYFLNLVGNIEKEYLDALNAIGYNPQEFEALFPGGEDSMEWINHGIDASYEDLDIEEFRKERVLPGKNVSSDIPKKLIYSIESFIKIMKDEM